MSYNVHKPLAEALFADASELAAHLQAVCTALEGPENKVKARTAARHLDSTQELIIQMFNTIEARRIEEDEDD